MMNHNCEQKNTDSKTENANRLKDLVGKTAVDTLITRGLIFSGMKIGLGTGSTAMPAVRRLAERIADGTLSDIKAVATSFQTKIACENLSIPVYSMNSRETEGELDLAIDGADEISPEKNLIKGGGAALLLEKIVAYNAKIFAVVADESKAVPHLGTKFPLPVEVIPEARIPVANAIRKLGAAVHLREGIRKAGPVITDNGNIILDLLWDTPPDPAAMEDELNKITGVVENGLFTRSKPIVFIAAGTNTVIER